MKKETMLRLVAVSLTVLMVFGFHSSALAAENGGAVQTNGVVGFYDNSTESSSSTEPAPSTTESEKPAPSESTTTSSTVVKKPTGSYPSTGELVTKSLSISGVVLLAGVLIFFLWKRRKDGEKEERP